jgi:hypothetical protein
LATTAYGAPSISAGQENIFVNQVLEFNGDNNWASFRVTYNSATEFLRTYEGNGAPDQVQDYSMGYVKISVANILRASSEVVANSVDLLLFVRCENVRVYEPKMYPYVEFDSSSRLTFATAAPTLLAEDEELVAEGPSGEVITDAPTEAASPETVIVANTASESNIQSNRACKLDVGRHFEYCVTDIHEILRRHSFRTILDNTDQTLFMKSPRPNYRLITFPVRYYSRWNNLFSAWSGHIKFRIYVYGTAPGFVAYNARPGRITTGTNSGFVMGNSSAVQASYDPATYITANGFADYHAPMEMMFPVSLTCSWIDVSIPFNSQLNMLPTGGYIQTPSTTVNGDLMIRIPLGGDYEIFQAAGDDYRYQVFCPRSGIAVRGANAGGGTDPRATPNTEVGGNMWTF